MPEPPKQQYRGGRKKGVPNRRTVALREKAGQHAAGSLAAIRRLSEKAEAAGDIATAMRGFTELAQYEAPKLRSIEVKKTGDGRGDFTLAELLATLKSIQDAKANATVNCPAAIR